MRPSHYTFGTFLGNLPRVLVATVFAEELAAALEDSANANWWDGAGRAYGDHIDAVRVTLSHACKNYRPSAAYISALSASFRSASSRPSALRSSFVFLTFGKSSFCSSLT
jgi:hypothetical protein